MSGTLATVMGVHTNSGVNGNCQYPHLRRGNSTRPFQCHSTIHASGSRSPMTAIRPPGLVSPGSGTLMDQTGSVGRIRVVLSWVFIRAPAAVYEFLDAEAGSMLSSVVVLGGMALLTGAGAGIGALVGLLTGGSVGDAAL